MYKEIIYFIFYEKDNYFFIYLKFNNKHNEYL